MLSDNSQLIDIARTAVGGFFFDTRYDYDNAGRVTEIEHFRNNDTTPFSSYSYGYDKADRIVQQITTHDTSIAAFGGVPASMTEVFAFDNSGQLTGNNSSVVGADESFTYDANGNRVGTDLDTGDYNRLSADADYTYLYDKEGNLVRKTEKSGFGGNAYTEYEYDHRNRLVIAQDFDVTGAPLTRIDYRYDASNKLVKRHRDELGMGPFVDPEDEHHFVYSGNQRVLTWNDEIDQLERRHLWGPGRDELLKDDIYGASGQLLDHIWAATDHLGSVNDLIATNEVIVEHREYDSFGALDAAYNELGNPVSTANLQSEVGYTGKFLDSATGLQYNNARWYDPSTGRFLSEDSIGFPSQP